jgi:glyoxylase-like metal-dependent hydrolase (beta-lactamase superfamily II)
MDGSFTSDVSPLRQITTRSGGLTRRRLLRRAAAVAGGAVLATGAAGLVASPRRAHAAGQVFVFESDANGFNTKTVFYDTGAAVVAFDTQFTPEYANQALTFLRTMSDRPLVYAVITHPNPDKFNGLTAFHSAGAKIVASRATVEAMPDVQAYKREFFVGAGMFTAETYPKLGTVDVVFEGSATLDLGEGHRVELRELSQPGISSTQTVAFLTDLDTLVVGDLVHHKAHAWLEGGLVDGVPTPNLAGWIGDLNELVDLFAGAPASTVYGGRGQATRLETAIADQVAYLERADQIVTDYVAGLGERRAELSGPSADAHYAALQQTFETAFPDYALGYMIRYGVYGLVNAKLASSQ